MARKQIKKLMNSQKENDYFGLNDLIGGSKEFSVMSRADIEKYYHKIAAKADARMRALEKRGGEILQMAYAKATKIIDTYNNGGKRFNTKAPSDLTELKTKITDIQYFLSLKSSTYTGYKKVVLQRAKTFNDKYKTDFTPMEIANLFEYAHAKNLDTQYGSGNIVRVVAELEMKRDDVLKLMEESKGKTDDIIKFALDRLEEKGMNAPYFTDAEKTIINRK